MQLDLEHDNRKLLDRFRLREGRPILKGHNRHHNESR